MPVTLDTHYLRHPTTRLRRPSAVLLAGMLAFEKEHAVMRTKCTDDAVWERYKPVLEDNRP